MDDDFVRVTTLIELHGGGGHQGVERLVGVAGLGLERHVVRRASLGGLDVVEEPAMLVIGEEERRALPERTLGEGVDDLGDEGRDQLLV